jgi:microcystin-dependent protein
MVDDRAWMDLAATVTHLKQQIDELRKQVNIGAVSGTVGDIEPTIRKTAKKGTLLLDGAVYSRSSYAILWQWANDNDLVSDSASWTLFGNGDGSSSFTVPNFKGRVPIGAGTLNANTYNLGEIAGNSTRTLAASQVPPHDHQYDWGGHVHSINYYPSGGAVLETNTHIAGAHLGHSGGQILVNSGTAFGVTQWLSNSWSVPVNPVDHGGASGNYHYHEIDQGAHFHGGNTGQTFVSDIDLPAAGSFDNRQPSVSINWLIWY